MKKITVFLVFTLFALSGIFADELIGKCLKYEVIPGMDYRVRVTDIFQGNWGYDFVVKRNVADVYDIYAYGGSEKIGTAKLGDDDFQLIISQYIYSTSQERNSEWREYASTIAYKIYLAQDSDYVTQTSSSLAQQLRYIAEIVSINPLGTIIAVIVHICLTLAVANLKGWPWAVFYFFLAPVAVLVIFSVLVISIMAISSSNSSSTRIDHHHHLD